MIKICLKSTPVKHFLSLIPHRVLTPLTVKSICSYLRFSSSGEFQSPFDKKYLDLEIRFCIVGISTYQNSAKVD
jgi:hypothetical protein